jgi:hypothetical protein
MNETYSMTTNGAVRRIRTPHPHDVLSGRGGGINSHVGNKAFREWVLERKEAYNLAGSKAEKARVATEVIDLVTSQNPSGRFLQRDSTSASGPSWWVEVDEARALAKTSQALREGAPQIRAAHKSELQERVVRSKKSKRKKVSASATPVVPATSVSVSQATTKFEAPTPTPTFPLITPNTAPRTQILACTRPVSTDQALESLQKNVQQAKSLADQQRAAPIIAPLMSNKEFEEKFTHTQKKPRLGEGPLNPLQFDPAAETPPLASAPHPPFSDIPPLKLRARSTNKTSGDLIRSHSLAMSDLSTGDFPDMMQEEFVNPFADESDIVNTGNDLSKPHPSRRLRNTSSDETADKKGDHNNHNTGFLGGRNRSSLGNMSSRYVQNSAHPTPQQIASNVENCFCDCAIPFKEGEACICGELANHLLNREDGLAFFLEESHSLMQYRTRRASARRWGNY